ncbi:hypothetical protein [Pelobium manganitolerans]|nr:hypothetical protein [Pelobium manganitolerans]
MAKSFYQTDMVAIRHKTLSTIKILGLSTIILFPCIVFGIFNLKYFTSFQKWNGVESVAICLTPYAVSQLFYLPLSNVALVLDKKKILLFLSLIQLCLTLFMYWIAHYFDFSFKIFLGMLSGSFALFTIFACRKFYLITLQVGK